MYKTSIKKSAGYTLIEQALVLPILLVFIFGAIDVSNTMQAYNALQEGVRTSLRCTYTVDGECIDVPTAAPSPLFNWYEITGTTGDEVYGYRYHYEGTEKYIQRPVYNVSNFRARTLVQHQFDVSYYSRQAHRRKFPAVGEVAGIPIFQARAPRVRVNSPEDSRFRYLEQPGVHYVNNLSYTIQNNITSTNNWIDSTASTPVTSRNLGTIRFRVNNPHQGAECRKSDQFNYASDSVVASNNGCGGHNGSRGNVVLWIHGDSQGSDNGATGVIDIRVDGPGLSMDLGGRKYTSNPGTRHADHVPRGIPSGYLAPGSAPYTEATDYPNVIVEFGQWYTISFTLRQALDEPSTYGKVFYNSNNMDLFAPRYGESENSHVECEGGLYPSEFSNPANCNTENGREALSVSWINHHSQPANFLSASDTKNLQDTADSAPLSDSELHNQLSGVVPASQLIDYYETPSSASEELIASETTDCPSNYGVVQEADGNDFVTTSAAHTICPAQQTHIGAIVEDSSKWLVSGYQQIPGNPSIDWVRPNCEEAAPQQVPAEVALYHHHDDGQISFSHYATQHIYTGPENAPENDPDYVVANDPLYNCSDHAPSFAVGSKAYNKDMEDLPQESLFAGLINELGCNWEEVVRDEAVSLGMNTSAFFEASFGNQTVTPLEGEPAECITFWKDPGEPIDGALIPLAGNPYPYGVVPAGCESDACHVEFIGFDGDGSGGAGEVEVDLEKAAQDFGFETVRALYPRASWDCEDDDCVDLEVAQDGQSMVSRGSVQVPMNLLLGESVEISYEEAETFEGELAR